jgi:hypothetical protein
MSRPAALDRHHGPIAVRPALVVPVLALAFLAGLLAAVRADATSPSAPPISATRAPGSALSPFPRRGGLDTSARARPAAMLQESTPTPVDCRAQDATPGMPPPTGTPPPAGTPTTTPCPRYFGYRWTGQRCEGVEGCECTGADCDEVAAQSTWLSCMLAHRACCSGGTPTPSPSPTETPIGFIPSPTPWCIDCPTWTPGPGTAVAPTFTPRPPSPTATPTSPNTVIDCACWPQDIEGIMSDGTATPCATPIVRYKHVGNGVCVKVTGCSFAGADSGGPIYGSMKECTDAFAACACAECDPLLQPQPVPTGTPGCDHCVGSTGRLDWRRWYPMDRGQLPGERALNWWEDPRNPCFYTGQSTWRFPGRPSGVPCDYGGEAVTAFFNWPCRDPQCNDYRGHMEIISERHDAQGNSLWLDHWGYGREDSWRVFYDPTRMDPYGTLCSCNEQTVAAMSPAEQEGHRVPMTMELPCKVGESVSSPITCSATYVSGPGGVRGYDRLLLGSKQGQTYDPVGLYFSRTTLLGYLSDPGEDCNVAHLLNEYFTTGCDRIDAECRAANGGSNARCEKVGDDAQAKRFTFRFEQLGPHEIRPYSSTPTPPGGATPTPGTCADCSTVFCLDVYEDWYVRLVPEGDPLHNGEYRNTGGMLGYWLDGAAMCLADQCPNWYIDPLQGVLFAPTSVPGTSPVPTPTAGGPTVTPTPTLELEDDRWQTLCEHDPLPCGTARAGNPTPTDDPWWCPTAGTMVAADPSSTANACGATSWPPSGTLTPTPDGATRTPVIDTGPGGPLTPYPTSLTVCPPTATPSPPTPTRTATPTLTATPSATPPDCGWRSHPRQCESQLCLPGWCTWSASEPSPPTLSCNPGGVFDVTFVAWECGTFEVPRTVDDVQIRYNLDSPEWSEWYDMDYQYGGIRSWTYAACALDSEPTIYQLRWHGIPPGGTDGIARLDVNFCCHTPGCLP